MRNPDAVIDVLPFGSRAAVVTTNRGALLACDGADPQSLIAIPSYCVWSEGVRSLLPRTDLVAFAREATGEAQTTLLVPWESAQGVCGSYLAPTQELPVRYRVEAFPTQAEWARLAESEHR